MPVTNWICIKCGVTNPKTYFKCQMCQEPKPIFWECSGCKTKNPTASVKCSNCKRKRPALFSNTVNIKGLSNLKFEVLPSCGQSSCPAPTLAQAPPKQCAQSMGSKSPYPSKSPFPQQQQQQPSTYKALPNRGSAASNYSIISGYSGYTTMSTVSGPPTSTLSQFSAPPTSTISQFSQNTSKISTSSQVSSYDIFRKLSHPSRTVRQINYDDNDSRYVLIFNACKSTNTPYTDKAFPPTARSLYFNADTYRKQVVANKANRVHWLRNKGIRPSDILNVKEANKLSWAMVRDPVASDITQGVLGNCWFLSALAVLVGDKPSLLDKILPSKELSKYGVYRIRLFKDGKLCSVVIDDMFPCNSKRFLIYSCAKRKQLFVPIIEKGMAKLYGCYESLVSGQTTEGLSALTGYPCRSIKLQNQIQPEDSQSCVGDEETLLGPDYIWTMLMSFQSAGFLMGAACGCVAVDEMADEKEYMSKGLLMRHAYSIINVTVVNGDIRLLRLRNPWGTQVWNGDWSDNSPLWTPELAAELKPNASSEGIFWISFSDFQRYFEKVDVCKLRDGWNELRFEGYFPFSCSDTRYLCVFEVCVEDSSTEIELTLHQESRRTFALRKTPLMPIGIALFQFKDVQRSMSGDLIEFGGYKIREFVGCDVLVDKGIYMAAIFAFNHWNMANETKQTGTNLRPRFILSAHSSRYITINPYCPSPTIIGDTLIELTITKGRKKIHNENVVSYYMHENWSGMMVVIENQNVDTHLEVIFDASESVNLSTTRGSLLTQDTIPPMSRQLVNILSQVDQTISYYLSYQMSYRVSNISRNNNIPDISKVLVLHSPRSFKQISG